MKSLSSYKNPIELTHEELKYKFTLQVGLSWPKKSISMSLQAFFSYWVDPRRTSVLKALLNWPKKNLSITALLNWPLRP